MWAADFATGKHLDAGQATYVEGSDVSHCAVKEIRRDGYGCCYVKGFDRCQPSLVAFADRAAAERFQQEHGGRIVPFAKLIER
jgi:alpha-D-ribose 1-methylphosphonate 5-triphosphate synthase subunit PhnG